MLLTMIPISKRKRACLYIYKKQNKCEAFIFIYKNPDTFQKATKFMSRFYSQKFRHFILRNFHVFLHWHLYIYKNHDTLRYVKFFYTKI